LLKTEALTKMKGPIEVYLRSKLGLFGAKWYLKGLFEVALRFPEKNPVT
jgi:hypothetical protein